MNPINNENWKALYATICKYPDADLPRLVAADWLDEQNDNATSAFAEFIRIQCELDGLGIPSSCTDAVPSSADPLILRESQLWIKLVPAFLKWVKVVGAERQEVVHRRLSKAAWNTSLMGRVVICGGFRRRSTPTSTGSGMSPARPVTAWEIVEVGVKNRSSAAAATDSAKRAAI